MEKEKAPVEVAVQITPAQQRAYRRLERRWPEVQKLIYQKGFVEGKEDIEDPYARVFYKRTISQVKKQIYGTNAESVIQALKKDNLDVTDTDLVVEKLAVSFIEELRDNWKKDFEDWKKRCRKSNT